MSFIIWNYRELGNLRTGKELEVIRDGNLDPTCGYPARLDPKGPDFTRPDKE